VSLGCVCVWGSDVGNGARIHIPIPKLRLFVHPRGLDPSHAAIFLVIPIFINWFFIAPRVEAELKTSIMSYDFGGGDGANHAVRWV
jgi:hypothetical protein